MMVTQILLKNIAPKMFEKKNSFKKNKACFLSMTVH